MSLKAKKILGALVLALLLVAGIGYYLFKENIGVVNIPGTQSINLSDNVPANSVADNIPSLPGFKLPAGFSINVFAKDLPGARVVTFDMKGRMLVSQTGKGKISVIESDGSGALSKSTKTLVSGLDNPHGMAFHCHEKDVGDSCKLYVAESNALTRFDYDEEKATVSNKTKLMDIKHGATDRHFTRSLLFLPSPDEHTVLISVGSSCDACNEKDADHAAILYYNVGTGEHGVYAKGLRNAVFMASNLVDGKTFATEMGRDGLGDNIPPDEIDVIEKGKNYGWPNCYGKNIRDDKFGGSSCSSFEQSFVDLQAHSAPLGLAFIPEESLPAGRQGWPEEYWYNLLVAYHGSWNRSEPTGYKIARIKMNAKGEYLGTEDLVSGWLTKEGSKTGRPVDIKVLSGGVAYISDDSSGVIYRLTANK